MIKSIKSHTQTLSIVFLLIMGAACSPSTRGGLPVSSNVTSSDVLVPNQNCGKPQATDPIIYTSDFKWGFKLDEMLNRFNEMYQSPKRLFNRAYYDENLKTYVMDVNRSGGAKTVKLTPLFLKSVRKHIEVSLQRHYADAVFFPDMGHSHLYIPKDLYSTLDKKYSMDEINLFYEEVLANKDVKFLYHTAEQLSVTADGSFKGPLSSNKYLQWRYYSRNVVGQNDGSDNVSILYKNTGEGYNTAGDDEMPGYTYYGGGFNVSANKEGCFEFQHEGNKYYYDLSFDDLQLDPANSSGQDGM